MKKSFRVEIKYNEYIYITAAELPKAYYAFMTDAKFIADSGESWSGKILGISQNWHGIMKWPMDRVIDGVTKARDIGSERIQESEAIMNAAKQIALAAISEKDIKKRKAILDQKATYELHGGYQLPGKVELLESLTKK